MGRKFTEEQLELAIIEMLKQQGYEYLAGGDIVRANDEILIKEDLITFLKTKYAKAKLTDSEIKSIIRMFEILPSDDIYGSNKIMMNYIANGFNFVREDSDKPALFINLIDYKETTNNIFKIVNQLEINGYEKRIPDGIIYINGLPLVVFEFKSAIREEATIHDAYVQLTTRYKRDIPELFKYNALCVISDGVNTKSGSFFADYEFFYAWRKITGDESIEKDGIDSLYTMINGLFNQDRLIDVIHNFIFIPDSSKHEMKVACRYPQYYAAKKLFENIKLHQKPNGDGKGGTYFGATGCGKSFTMLFLSRLLMKDKDMASPTIILITDRTDLDDQLSGQFTEAKKFLGDENIKKITSRKKLKELLQGRKSGGVFLTTVHKFTEDLELLSDRTNIICISDEAHRTQTNLEQKVTYTEQGIKKTYGFAKYLHDSLPNATYVGFTGTPIDSTLDVFGDIVDSYTMRESVEDEITVDLVYAGRAARVLLNNEKLKEIEEYYKLCEAQGSSDYEIEASKKAIAQMNTILGDPHRIKTLAKDFVEHYEDRVSEGATVKGKAMVVCYSREIAYELFKEIIAIRPEWNEIKVCDDSEILTEAEKKEIKPIERVKMIMTRNKDDAKELYDLLGTKDDRVELDRQYKNLKSNFKIAIVVDMWLTGFDVPALDTIYIDKPLQKHNLIQTISRVNRKFKGKEKGLVVDYIGIKKKMNLALAHYSKGQEQNFDEINQSVIVVKDHLDLLSSMFHSFDNSKYFNGEPLEQLHCLNLASEYVQSTSKNEKRFMHLVKILKSAYDICCGSDELSDLDRDYIHFYLAVRSIVYKLNKGDAPDTVQMNSKVQQMIQDALESDGVEEIFALGKDEASEINIFDEAYLAKLDKIKLPNTKIKTLQKLLKTAISDFKKVNKVQATKFSDRFKKVVDAYNERSDSDILVNNVLDDLTDEIMSIYSELIKEVNSSKELGIDIEEKAFYDILKELSIKYNFEYPEEKLLELSKSVKELVDDKTRFTDWDKKESIKAELQVGLILLLAHFKYPPEHNDEAYREIFEQAENFKKHRA